MFIARRTCVLKKSPPNSDLILTTFWNVSVGGAPRLNSRAFYCHDPSRNPLNPQFLTILLEFGWNMDSVDSLNFKIFAWAFQSNLTNVNLTVFKIKFPID